MLMKTRVHGAVVQTRRSWLLGYTPMQTQVSILKAPDKIDVAVQLFAVICDVLFLCAQANPTNTSFWYCWPSLVFARSLSGTY